MKRHVASLMLALFITSLAWAWAAAGHRTITVLALGLLPPEAPAWLREPSIMERIAFESNEPDRWRGVTQPSLNHANNPDHYLDIEILAEHGLTLRTMPAMRYEFIAAITKKPSAPTTQSARGVQRFISEDIGTLPYAIMEHHAKLVSSFNTLRILEGLNEPARAAETEAARWNVILEMGQLSHFVGDAGQPLHTTIHHHGWVGENPHAYTTDRGFHAYIDVDVVALHALNAEALKSSLKPLPGIAPGGVWEAAIALIERSFAAIEPLYQLQQSGELQKDAGRKLIADRMADSAQVLAAFYWLAWQQSEPTQQQIDTFVKFDDFGEEQRWAVPATQPGP